MDTNRGFVVHVVGALAAVACAGGVLVKAASVGDRLDQSSWLPLHLGAIAAAVAMVGYGCCVWYRTRIFGSLWLVSAVMLSGAATGMASWWLPSISSWWIWLGVLIFAAPSSAMVGYALATGVRVDIPHHDIAP